MQGPVKGFSHLPKYLSREQQESLLTEIRNLVKQAPLYVPTMPRTGKPFSVRMSNCGSLGWVSDRNGYRYQAKHPATGAAWPPIPPSLLHLWARLAGFAAPPEACLVNFYAATAKLGSHADTDEQEFRAPVLSVSLGDSAVFHVGGEKRADPKTRIRLESGDVVILGGEARRAYHGIDRILAGTSDLLPEGGRINLTLRRVTPALEGDARTSGFGSAP